MAVYIAAIVMDVPGLRGKCTLIPRTALSEVQHHRMKPGVMERCDQVSLSLTHTHTHTHTHTRAQLYILSLQATLVEAFKGHGSE